MKYVVGNWKAQLSLSDSRSLALKIRETIKEQSGVSVWVTPSSHSLHDVAELLAGSSFKVGAQNCWGDYGAFTGELTAPAAKALGCTFCLIGHSERRHIFMESDEIVAQRFNFALDGGFTPILCVGEKLEERESGQTFSVIERQLAPLLATDAEKATSAIIAYEPVWAIGTGKVATEEQIEEVHTFIASKLPVSTIPILYGGSVSPFNFAGILNLPHTHGGLIGGASLKVDSFAELCSIAGM